MQSKSKFKMIKNIVISAAMMLFIFGCERAAPVQNQPIEVTLTSIQANVFDLNCAVSGCHLGSSAPLGLDLSEGNAFGSLVNVPSGEVPALMRVLPGDPENSYLVHKIEGRPTIIGDRMPRGRPDPLTSEEIQAVRDWIAAGAKDN